MIDGRGVEQFPDLVVSPEKICGQQPQLNAGKQPQAIIVLLK
jgi:hypothetical protein